MSNQLSILYVKTNVLTICKVSCPYNMWSQLYTKCEVNYLFTSNIAFQLLCQNNYTYHILHIIWHWNCFNICETNCLYNLSSQLSVSYVKSNVFIMSSSLSIPNVNFKVNIICQFNCPYYMSSKLPIPYINVIVNTNFKSIVYVICQVNYPCYLFSQLSLTYFKSIFYT